jgi:serine-type D-Ala-D-Ala carboxypeptidase (penicillin-binding protein 5/6)
VTLLAARPIRALTLVLLAAVAATAALGARPAAAAAPPCPASVKAPSAIVIEVSTGDVACERNADQRRAIASTTKLMTALLTLERTKLSDVFKAARYFAPPVESQIGLDPGERMTVRDLLRGLLVESANDAAVTLAEGVAGSRGAFVKAMNRRAQQLDLRNTHYSNPIGLDERGNYSTARDLVRLAIVLRTNPFFRTTVDRPHVTLYSGNRTREFDNRNDLVGRVRWINGVKSGHTRQAGYVLVGSGRQRGIQLVSAVLGTAGVGARDDATKALLLWGFHRFQRITAVRRDQVLARVPIRYRRGAELPLVASRSVRRVVPRGHRADVSWRVKGVPASVTGPVTRGHAFGAIEIIQGGRPVARVPLVAAASVPEADLEQKAKSWFSSPLPLLLAFAVLAGTVLVGRQVRRSVRNGRRTGEHARAA